QLLAELARDALGHGAGRDPARLGMADQLPPPAVAELEQHLGDLRGLTGTGGACDDDHLVLEDRGLDVLPALGDGQIPRIGQAQPGGCGCGRVRLRGWRGHGGPTLRGARDAGPVDFAKDSRTRTRRTLPAPGARPEDAPGSLGATPGRLATAAGRPLEDVRRPRSVEEASLVRSTRRLWMDGAPSRAQGTRCAA